VQDAPRTVPLYPLHGALSRAASRDPNHDAVRHRGRSLTYGQLDAASNRLANALIAHGVAPGDRVALFLPKGFEAVVGLYGAMKAGAAYVPIDPHAPVPRAATVAADCTVAAVVSTPSRAAALLQAMEPHRPRVVVLAEDGSDPAELACPVVPIAEVLEGNGDDADPAVPVIEDDLAYILYTSGSTGVPKGVMLSHRNALAFVEWCGGEIGVGADDRLSNHAPFHFDLSVFDLYLAALGGATVVIVPEDEAYFGAELHRLIRDEGITVWYSVPSALVLLTRAMSEPGELPTLRDVVFAGEVYPTARLRELQRLVPGARLWNLYGPTETNVITYYEVPDLGGDDDATIPIGRACANTHVFAVTDDGKVAGVGEVGELHGRGPTVMSGYWNRPEKTAEVLVPNPVGSPLPDLVYRTGDLVRLRPDGTYDFLGRRDHQIKSRGYRIELGEIEAALHALPTLSDAVAVALPHSEWGTEVVACVVPKDGAEVTEREVRRHVAQRLPRYMVPARVRIVSDLPRTSTGKVDRQRLVREVSALLENRPASRGVVTRSGSGRPE